ncbi:sodium/glutamate symporter [Brachybacterium sacelli]|uniref:ESS family glutamate:Na+ symporter n=1 Tax=Brachybacterium sacelli TaxID=173364 RepID=A0ABS4WYY2_9MICO|nr:sodium/glutamate symporter [Brachybacterium sacelli]MBP2381405.1 ESS family glutamate:Na+ symporter [Brachybacterium sacelli]
MPDLLPLDENSLGSLLLAVAGLGVLLLLGVLLRALVPLLRRFFIPAALLGGLVGLLLGPHALGLVPESITTTWSGIAGILITIVFAPMLMGTHLPKVREAAREAAPHVFYSYFSSFAVVAVPALLTFFVFTPLFGTTPIFSTIFEVSWPGGHGTAAGMEEAYTALGWGDGSSVALGSATGGLVFGIVAGMVMINIAARTGQLANYSGGGTEVASDILPEHEAQVESTGRLQRASLDNLAFHLSLIAVAVLLGYGLKYVVDMVITGVPLFPLAMIGGLLVHLVIVRTPAQKLVDKATLNSIAGVALDFLVVSAVASLSLPVLLENWQALAITLTVMAVMSVAIFYWIGPRIFGENWVENSIVNFGAMTGVVSIGLVLLRAADPNFRTGAFRGFALRAPFASPFVGGGLVTAMFPIAVANWGNLGVGITCALLCALLIGLAMLTGVWKSPSARAADRGEQSVPVR